MPATASPLPSITLPLEPLDAVPELKLKAPLFPAAPAFSVRITTAPLLLALPYPL